MTLGERRLGHGAVDAPPLTELEQIICIWELRCDPWTSQELSSTCGNNFLPQHHGMRPLNQACLPCVQRQSGTLLKEGAALEQPLALPGSVSLAVRLLLKLCQESQQQKT